MNCVIFLYSSHLLSCFIANVAANSLVLIVLLINVTEYLETGTDILVVLVRTSRQELMREG